MLLFLSYEEILTVDAFRIISFSPVTSRTLDFTRSERVEYRQDFSKGHTVRPLKLVTAWYLHTRDLICPSVRRDNLASGLGMVGSKKQAHVSNFHAFLNYNVGLFSIPSNRRREGIR